VAATPDLRWVVGGCMDATVHIWHIEQRAGPPLTSSSGAAPPPAPAV